MLVTLDHGYVIGVIRGYDDETGHPELVAGINILSGDISIGDTVDVPVTKSMESLPDDIRDLSKYRPVTGDR